MVPVFYVESEDENIESIQLLALNTDNEPMAKYFIHQQEVIMGVPKAVALENCVVNTGCTTGYKKTCSRCDYSHTLTCGRHAITTGLTHLGKYCLR